MAKAVGAWPRQWGSNQGLEGVAKAVEASPTPRGRGLGRGAVSKPWGRSQSLGGVAKAVWEWPRPWERGQGRGGIV